MFKNRVRSCQMRLAQRVNAYYAAVQNVFVHNDYTVVLIAHQNPPLSISTGRILTMAIDIDGAQVPGEQSGSGPGS